jgi:hypothetical protein
VARDGALPSLRRAHVESATVPQPRVCYPQQPGCPCLQGQHAESPPAHIPLLPHCRPVRLPATAWLWRDPWIPSLGMAPKSQMGVSCSACIAGFPKIAATPITAQGTHPNTHSAALSFADNAECTCIQEVVSPPLRGIFGRDPDDSDDATEEGWMANGERPSRFKEAEGKRWDGSAQRGGDSVSPTITCYPASAPESSTVLVSAGSMGQIRIPDCRRRPDTFKPSTWLCVELKSAAAMEIVSYRTACWLRKLHYITVHTSVIL